MLGQNPPIICLQQIAALAVKSMPGKFKINIVAIWLNTFLLLCSKAKVLQAPSASPSGQASNGGLAEARETTCSLIMFKVYIGQLKANNRAISSSTSLETQCTQSV